ncbi:hypothetical protein GOP47_0008711 [Adiantum capillus-veneris]|uniref:Disease resistance R13L4/SHOC-2-like LRR domain-containing protein n=1 Tax=Adiantum capillus-veneris TaxID=13818 RepID=A0A9D4ZKN6_ADICA|nr:hypothetical protein GOP47_0008711 [Adiantum capillus-veneris]
MVFELGGDSRPTRDRDSGFSTVERFSYIRYCRPIQRERALKEWAAVPGLLATAAATTNPGEVESLQFITSKMRLPKWNLSVDPCEKDMGPSFIRCSCSNSSCHVSELIMDKLNLFGAIPPEIANFTHLQKLSMERNLLSGPFLVELGRLGLLTFLNIGINQLSGSLPPELGNLTKLEMLFMGNNRFSGAIPAEIGHLTLLSELHVDRSGFSGEIPKELGQLTKLQTLWMFGNNFHGQIPDVFENMSNFGQL